jgi:superfamily II DNA or RNA helicase
LDTWDDHGCGLILRRYQQRALDRFGQLRRSQRKFFLVAPPGSGKTILGLRMAAELGAPALALSPTTTIAGQWLARLASGFVRVAGDGGPPTAALEVGSPALLYSLTYQRLVVTTDDGRRHPNVDALQAALAAHGVRTLLLDECHHLRGAWGEAIEELLARLPETFVVGLTATAAARSDGPLARLLGEPDHRISLPSVIRTGDLAPFQELVFVTTPSREEHDLLAGRAAALERAWQVVLAQTSTPAAPSLSAWIESFLAGPQLAGEPVTLLAALDAEPDLVVALMRLLTAADRFHPPELPPLPELEEPLTLGDRALLMAWWLAAHPAAVAPPEAGDLPELLAAFGYAARGGRVVASTGEVREAVGFSREKLVALREIVRVELAALGDGLRMLVLTDYEFPPERRRAISCRDVVETLASDPATDAVDPVLVTGRSLIVDDDLWPRFAAELERIAARDGLEIAATPLPAGGAVEVSGSGEDWTTRVLVAVVTELLERGVTRCLVGTRSLLGEGWDCLRLNTLVDLTVVTSGVAVNQVRGRTLRLDPEDPAKVADNWDVLCWSPEAGDYELARLRERHDQLYGVAPDGSVERGLGHLHPWLASGWRELGARREELNAVMRQRAGARHEARGWWRVGQPFADEDWPALELRLRPVRRRTPGAAREAAEAAVAGLAVTAGGYRRFTHLRLGLAGAVVAGAAAAWAVAPGVAVAAALSVGLAGGAWAAGALAGRRLAAGATVEAELASLAGVVLAAEGGPGSATVRRTAAETLVVEWQDVDGERAAALTRALAELVGSGHGQRWLLRDRTFVRSGWRWRPEERCFPVPRAWASRRRLDQLLAVWRARRSPEVAAVHADTPEGRALLERHWHRAGAATSRVRWLWR